MSSCLLYGDQEIQNYIGGSPCILLDSTFLCSVGYFLRNDSQAVKNILPSVESGTIAGSSDSRVGIFKIHSGSVNWFAAEKPDKLTVYCMNFKNTQRQAFS